MQSLAEIYTQKKADVDAYKAEQASKQARAVAAKRRARERVTAPINRQADRISSARYNGALFTFHERAGAILGCLTYIANFHGIRGYCFPSQQTIVDKLSRWYGVKLSRSTLNRDLRQMEDNGLLKRVRRHRARTGGGIEFNSTLYKFTRRGFRWLKAMRNIIFSTVFSRVSNLAQYIPSLQDKEDCTAVQPPEAQAKLAPDGAG